MRGPEKREWQRIAVDMAAKCRLIDGPARYELMRIVDIHHQGCCIEGHVQFSKDDVVRIIVDLPFEGQIGITGAIVWSGSVNENDDFRAGVHFILDNPSAEEMCLKLYHYCLLRQPKT